jgi:hypothetical protein
MSPKIEPIVGLNKLKEGDNCTLKASYQSNKNVTVTWKDDDDKKVLQNGGQTYTFIVPNSNKTIHAEIKNEDFSVDASITITTVPRKSRSLDCEDSNYFRFPSLDGLQNCILKNYSNDFFEDNSTQLPDYHGVSIDSFPLKKFPENFGRIFPNLTAIGVTNAKLPNLVRADLTPYASELQFLNVSGNELDTIDRNLFENCTKLTFIDMSDNFLFFIHGHAFDTLTIGFISMRNNGCVDGDARNDGEMRRILRKVRGECHKNYLVKQTNGDVEMGMGCCGACDGGKKAMMVVDKNIY